MSDEPRVLKPEEIQPIVMEKAKEMRKILHEAVDGVHPTQQWLISARIFNLLFAFVYKPMLTVLTDPEAKP